MKNKFVNWLLVFLWAGLIFFLSSQPDLKSGLPGSWDFILRKLAHISEYAVLTFLVYHAFSQHQLTKKQALAFSFLGALFYAISDEYHQAFVSGRHGVWTDVLIDSLGVFLVIGSKIKKMVK